MCTLLSLKIMFQGELNTIIELKLTNLILIYKNLNIHPTLPSPSPQLNPSNWEYWEELFTFDTNWEIEG